MSEQAFIKRIKFRIAFSVIIISAGLAIMFIPNANPFNLVSGYRYGAMGGLIGAGLSTIINSIIFD